MYSYYYEGVVQTRVSPRYCYLVLHICSVSDDDGASLTGYAIVMRTGRRAPSFQAFRPISGLYHPYSPLCTVVTPSIANTTPVSSTDRPASPPCCCATYRPLHACHPRCHPVPDDVRSIDLELKTRRNKRIARPWLFRCR